MNSQCSLAVNFSMWVGGCKQPLQFISFISLVHGSHWDEKRAADGDSEIGLNVSSVRIAS
jgi:hypothetical protein